MKREESLSDIIVAPATASGGALTLLRLSGAGSIALCDKIFDGRTPLTEAPSHTLHYGTIRSAEGEVIDDLLLSLFRAPRSYTGEESVEISCHGSQIIVLKLLERLIEAGARPAAPGEFTQRAYLNGRLDLSQAEAVADLIAARSEAALNLASRQMRGNYSSALEELRAELVRLSALVELELDFSEEDVEFADRGEIAHTMEQILREIVRLEESFRVGNALREGVAVAIVGEPNVGKSTLLNRLVGDERAMVSEIAGTTRDTIEERIRIQGVEFRFIDTAGLHQTEDRLKQMGIHRTLSAIKQAEVVLQVADAGNPDFAPLQLREDQHHLLLLNKADLLSQEQLKALQSALSERPQPSIILSAKLDQGVDQLRHLLRQTIDTGALERGETIVSNSRHCTALKEARLALLEALEALRNGLPTDLLAEDLRQVAHHLGTITGSEISSSEILQAIFSKFCIGK